MALVDAGDDAARRGQILGDRALALGGARPSRRGDRRSRPGARTGAGQRRAQPRAGLRAPLRRPAVRRHRADRSGRSRSIPALPRRCKTLALAQARDRQGRRGRRRSCSGRCATDPLDRDAILQLSFLHIERSRFAEALETLEPYLKAAPDDVRALNNQGLALRGLKRFDEARRALKRASRLATDDPLVLTNLGRVLVDLGRAAEARSLHEHALRGLPGDPRLLGHYGACLAALGERDKARETLDAALAADPNNAEALAARTEPRTHERRRRSSGRGAPAHRRSGAAPPAAIRLPSPWSPSPRPMAPSGCASCWTPASACSARTACRRREEKFPALKAELSRPRAAPDRPAADQQGARGRGACSTSSRSVDRERLAATLAKEMARPGRRPDCFIQVNTGEEPQKAGVLPAERRCLRRRLPRHP